MFIDTPSQQQQYYYVIFRLKSVADKGYFFFGGNRQIRNRYTNSLKILPF